MLTKLFCKHLELGLSSQNCLYFQGFWGPNLLNGCLVVWPTQRALHVESTSNPRRFHVDSTNFHVIFTGFFRCYFADRKIHVVFMYFFRCNFDGRKIHVVFTYFFRCNFDGRKIHLATTYFFQCNFSRRNIHDVSTYFFRLNFDGRKIHFFAHNFFDEISMKSTSFLVSCKLMKTFEGVFLC